MKREVTDEQLIALIESSSNAELEKLVQQDEQLLRRVEEMKEVLVAIENSGFVEVPAHIEMNFRETVQREQSNRGRSYSWMQIAAAIALLVLGFSIGRFSENGNASELASLKSEIQSLKDLTLTSALQQHSASERIMAVNQIESSAQSVNPKLVATLINTLNTDESPSVRYAALQAISNFIDKDEVRAQLVKSLESQKDALIQISLITILVDAEERSAIAPLKDIIDNEDVTPEVKQQAEIAIKVLT